MEEKEVAKMTERGYHEHEAGHTKEVLVELRLEM